MRQTSAEELIHLLRITRKWGVISESDEKRLETELRESVSETLGETGALSGNAGEGSAAEARGPEEDSLRWKNEARPSSESMQSSPLSVRSADY
jgi:hypothetical protein